MVEHKFHNKIQAQNDRMTPHPATAGGLFDKQKM